MVGAGWAGLAAAVRGVQQGWTVSLFEMAHHAGGRARSVSAPAGLLDNGQHILIGAYRQTLALMATVGVPMTDALTRQPLALRFPDGHGLALPTGAPLPALLRGVLTARGWSAVDKIRLLRAATQWWADGFHCSSLLTVEQLCAGLPEAVLDDLVRPLCVAALNTPARQASATVFLRVLQDALFAGPGSADLLLPRLPLSRLMPQPALAWLQQRGATVILGHRVRGLTRHAEGWQVDSIPADAVVLACSAREAAALAEPHAPSWSTGTRALVSEPIITGWLQDEQLTLPRPMLALREGPAAPAQFVFDLGQLGQRTGLFSWVISGAAPWVAAGPSATAEALLAQARACFPTHFQTQDALVHMATERRATFACTPVLHRPAQHIAGGLVAAGDYIEGPYPATLEGAVRSGESAVTTLGATSSGNSRTMDASERPHRLFAMQNSDP